MKKTLLAFALLAPLAIQAQYLHLLHTVQFPSVTNQYGVVGGSDCWGYTDTNGVDYAIMGNSNKISFVRASDGMIVDEVEAPANQDPYYHRDIKTHGHYAYIVGECTGTNEGLTIVDLSPLPDSVRFVAAWTNGGSFVRGHNIDIDEGTGHLYIESDEFIGAHGVDIVDVTSPEAPVKVGFINTPGVHDMNARNDTVWVAEGSTPAYSVWNCADKSNPILLGRVTMPSFGYCHNIWPSDDGKFFFTGEETGNKTVKCWDATDLGDITLRGTYLGPSNLVHNIHVEGKFLYMSHYTAGIRVVDWSDPDNLVEVGAHDTYPNNDNTSFHGAWGVYPHATSNYVYGSDMEAQLNIYEWLPLAVSVSEPIIERKGIWPNPMAQYTNIPLQLASPAHVEVSIADLQGRLVAKLFSGDLLAGNHTLPWHSDPSLANGAYFVKVQIGNELKSEKLLLQR